MWFVFSLLAGFFWALSNVMDRWFVLKFRRFAIFKVLVVALFSISFSSVVMAFFLGGNVRVDYIGPSLIALGTMFIVMMFYYLALARDKVEVVAPLLSFSVVFSFFIDMLFLSSFSLYDVLGVFLVFLGSFLVGWMGKVEGIAYALMAAFSIALRNEVGVLFSLSLVDFIATYGMIGLLLSVILFLMERDFSDVYNFFFSNFINGLAFGFFVLSLKVGVGSFPSALSQISTVIVVILGGLVFGFDRSFFFVKLAGSILIFLGSFMIIS